MSNSDIATYSTQNRTALFSFRTALVNTNAKLYNRDSRIESAKFTHESIKSKAKTTCRGSSPKKIMQGGQGGVQLGIPSEEMFKMLE